MEKLLEMAKLVREYLQPPTSTYQAMQHFYAGRPTFDTFCRRADDIVEAHARTLKPGTVDDGSPCTAPQLYDTLLQLGVERQRVSLLFLLQTSAAWSGCGILPDDDPMTLASLQRQLAMRLHSEAVSDLLLVSAGNERLTGCGWNVGYGCAVAYSTEFAALVGASYPLGLSALTLARVQWQSMPIAPPSAQPSWPTPDAVAARMLRRIAALGPALRVSVYPAVGQPPASYSWRTSERHHGVEAAIEELLQRDGAVLISDTTVQPVAPLPVWCADCHSGFWSLNENANSGTAAELDAGTTVLQPWPPFSDK